MVSRLVVFVLAALASVPFAEATFRMLGDSPSRDLGGLFQAFGEGSYKLAPNVVTDAALASGHVSVYTDDLGLRCDRDRRFATVPGDKIDVVVVGDSQGFGNGVNYEDSIAGSLARAADQDGYRVANTSVGGHSLKTQFSLIRWLHEEQHLEFANLVILLTPVMVANCDADNHAIVGGDGRLYGQEVGPGMRVRKWMKTSTVVYGRVRDAVRGLGVGLNPGEASPMVFSLYSPGDPEQQARRALGSCLGKFLTYGTALGASLQVVYVPLTIEADFDPTRRAAARHGIILDEQVPLRICAEVADDLTLRLHSLKPTVIQAHAERLTLNVKGDAHYSPALSRRCGKSVWDSLDLPRRTAREVTDAGD